MNDELNVCIDRILPVQRTIEGARRSVEENPANQPSAAPDEASRSPLALPPFIPNDAIGVERFRLAILTGTKWQPGRTLRVMFLDGDPRVQLKVQQVAQQWEQFANIKFAFGVDPNAEIRISFRDEGSWSYIGTDCLSIPRSSPTMNYGWLTPTSTDDEYSRVVLHEFGHALGCIHEHQNPAGNIQWNKPVVYASFAGSPNFWSKEDVDHNLFEKYSTTITQFSALDPQSIMFYSLPAQFTTNGFSVDMNQVLSETDKTFIKAVYPGVETGTPLTRINIDGPAIEAAIGQHGEIDLFQFAVTTAGTYTVQTKGRSDVVMKLFGPNNQTTLIAEDDDSGSGNNAKISHHLVIGSYVVQVRHYRPRGTGKYSILVQTGAL